MHDRTNKILGIITVNPPKVRPVFALPIRGLKAKTGLTSGGFIVIIPKYYYL